MSKKRLGNVENAVLEHNEGNHTRTAVRLGIGSAEDVEKVGRISKLLDKEDKALIIRSALRSF